MMIVKNQKLTKTCLEDKNTYQCYYNNTGYCKFRDHCRYQHYSEVCSKSICTDKQCRFRHPRTCKHGDDCKFYERNYCLFSHKSNIDVKNRKTDKLEKEVEELKMEILNLKATVNDKGTELDELEKLNEKQIRRLKELEKERLDLVQISREKDQQIKVLKEEIGEKNKEIIKRKSKLECEKCDFKANNFTMFLVNLSKKHNAGSNKN